MKHVIEEFTTEPLRSSRFIVPVLARYKHNGIEKSWEMVKAYDSVAVLIYHTQRDAFVIVRQFRPAVYMHHGVEKTVELCAGIIDKKLPEVQIVREEIEEECGYLVPLEDIERITSIYTSVGFSGSKQTLYYAEVNDTMRVGDGGGVDDEDIEVIELPVSEAFTWMYDETVAKTAGLMFAFMWWKERKHFLVHNER